MIATSSQCFAIAQADKAGTLSLIERNGRFGSFIAICDDRGTIEVAHTRAEANERLIAAAPELLEALEVFHAFGCPRCSGDCAGANPPVMTCPMQVAQSAIAKARGEA